MISLPPDLTVSQVSERLGVCWNTAYVYGRRHNYRFKPDRRGPKGKYPWHRADWTKNNRSVAYQMWATGNEQSGAPHRVTVSMARRKWGNGAKARKGKKL